MIYSNGVSFSYFHITYIALSIFTIIENKFDNIVTVIYEYLTNIYYILINIHTDK